ncbi:hypothetical protein R1M86_18585 [Klebsiella sp. 80660]|uniref:aspartate-alanine antiporter-like transporter n=1 Tax=Klebsiella TaxID=570 RepID=UPI00223FF9C1|nr:hypothetical protein [Klebsiella pneumoniae]
MCARQHTIRLAAVIIPVNNNVIHRDGTMSEIALTVSVLALVAVVGLKSGGDFVATLTQGDGLSWIAYGIFITAIPLLTVGILARMLAKMNYLTLCGMLAGSMTDPPALAFANNLHATSGAAALSYATVYPLVMFLRIITPQLLAVLFWGLS